MTGRTHDLAAFTALSFIVANQPPSKISLATVLVSLSANFIGGLTPDIDQPTADLWHRLPAGGVIGKILSPLLGGHRFISHSVLGIIIFGFGFNYLLEMSKNVLIIDKNLVWYSFMIGYISHLIMDTFTREGVPWLFPIPLKIGIPPIRALRIKTGGLIEKAIIFPGLLLINFYIFYLYHHVFWDFIKHHIT